MSNVVVARDQVDTPPPPRREGLVIAVGVIALIVLFAVFGRSEPASEAEPDLGVAATTTTTTIRDLTPAIQAGQTLIDAQVLAAGPHIEWREVALPAGVRAVYAIGEFDGRPSILATREPPTSSGLFPGIELFVGDGLGGWDEPGFSLGRDEQVVTADIGPSGFVVVASLRAAAKLPYESDHAVVYASPNGREWQQTVLTGPGGERLTNLQAAVGTETTSSWVTALRIADDAPEVTAALPDAIRGLVERGSARSTVEEDRVAVRLPLGFTLFEAPLSSLGVEPAQVPVADRRTGVAWASDDLAGFDRVAEAPTGLQVLVSMTRGVDGRLLVIDAAREILASREGRDWEPAGDLSHLGFGTATIQSIDGVVVSIHNRTVEFLDDATGEYVLVPPEGRGISPHVMPSGGPAGLALATASNGPDYAVRTAEVAVQSAGRSLVIDPGERTITVYDGQSVVDQFMSPRDDDRVVYDMDREVLILDGSYEVAVAELERAYLARLVPAARGPFGVAFSPDGIEWGWAAVADDDGSPIGPIARLAVGEATVYAVIGQPALPNTPVADTGVVPRLLVGAIGD